MNEESYISSNILASTVKKKKQKIHENNYDNNHDNNKLINLPEGVEERINNIEKYLNIKNKHTSI